MSDHVIFDQLSAEILASLIKGFPTTTTTKQNVDPAVYYVYSRVKRAGVGKLNEKHFTLIAMSI
jgi:hypothetical protein